MVNYLKGKGAQFNPVNKFLKHHFSTEDPDGYSEYSPVVKPKTQVFFENPKKIISKNDSPDLNMVNSINPYQGCEHGCIYCYARNSHQYWGFGAGLDFESKIVVKKNVADTLRKELLNPNWEVAPIMLSGNTDCYQPLERKFKLTRKILHVLNEFKHPAIILTKNALIERDMDIISELASDNLIHVAFSITTLDEKLRRIMEPRTATIKAKLRLIERFSKEGIPVGVMHAPIIPGLNHHEIPNVMKAVADAGAGMVGYTVVRLNGVIGDITRDWLEKNFPDRFSKVWNHIKSMHGGNVNDSNWGRRIVGDGQIALTIKKLHEVSRRKYLPNAIMPELNTSMFRRRGNFSLF